MYIAQKKLLIQQVKLTNLKFRALFHKASPELTGMLSPQSSMRQWLQY